MLLNNFYSKKALIVWVFLSFLSIGTYYVYAGAGHDHGAEEASKLWKATAPQVTEEFVSPEEVTASDIPTSSYPGLITSNAYGSIFVSREGIITQLSVNIGDTVSKGQVIGMLATASNTPEIVSLIATKKSEIAIAEWKREAALQVKKYTEKQMQAPDATFQNAYDQKRNATELSYQIRKEKLLAQILWSEAQIEAKKKTITANSVSATANIESSDQKVVVAQKILRAAVDSTYSTITRIFYASDEAQMKKSLGFSEVFLSNTNQKNIFPFQQKIATFVTLYNGNDISTREGLIRVANVAEEALRMGLTVISATDVTLSYPSTRLESDKRDIIELLGSEDGVSVALNKIQQIQKESVSSNAGSESQFAQSKADMVSLEQEIILLQKELAQLDTEKQKDLAAIAGDQSVQSLELYTLTLGSKQIINESNRDLIVAEAEARAAQKALSAVLGVSSQSPIYAQFSGTISRKNVTVGQSVQTSTPIYDIVGNTTVNIPFVRWDISVTDLSKISINKEVDISLPGSIEKHSILIKRVANSVNKIDQTVSFEGAFIKEIPFPLGTQIRIMPDRVSEFSYKIPKSALFRESEQAFVWKVLPSQKLTQWKVTALQTSGEEYVFVTEGLSEESVIVRDARSQAWTEGQIVSSAEKE